MEPLFIPNGKNSPNELRIADCGFSRNEPKRKEEAHEGVRIYWMELLVESGILQQSSVAELQTEGDEIVRIELCHR
jgi:hypothetical protein